MAVTIGKLYSFIVFFNTASVEQFYRPILLCSLVVALNLCGCKQVRASELQILEVFNVGMVGSGDERKRGSRGYVVLETAAIC